MPKLDLDAIEQTNRTGYPPPFDERRRRAAGTAASRRPTGLTDFGVSHVMLEARRLVVSQRHWHDGEDEFLVMLEGEAVLVEDDGGTVLRAGDCRGLAQGQRQRPSPDQRQRRGLRLRRVRRRRPIPAAAIPTSTCMFTADETTSTRTARLIRQAPGGSSYCSITHGSSCACVDPFLDVRVRQHRLHVERRRTAAPGRRR